MSIYQLKLPIYEKMVLMLIRDLEAKHETVFPSYETIAELCSMSRRKAVLVVKRLVELGLLSKQLRPDKPLKNDSNVYASAPDAPAAEPDSAPCAPYKDPKSLKPKPEEDDIYKPLGNLLSKFRMKSLLSAIVTRLPDIHTYHPSALRYAVYVAWLRMSRGDLLYHPAAWIAEAAKNAQLKIELRTASARAHT